MGDLNYCVITKKQEYMFMDESCFGALNNIEDRLEYEEDNTAIIGVTWEFTLENSDRMDKCIDYLLNRCRYTKCMNTSVNKRKGYTYVCIKADVTIPVNKMMWQLCVWRDLVEKFHYRLVGTTFYDIARSGCNETLALILAEASYPGTFAKYGEECVYAPMTLDHIEYLVMSDLDHHNPQRDSYAEHAGYSEIKTYWTTGYSTPDYNKRHVNFLSNFQTYSEALDFMFDYDNGRLFKHRIKL